MSKMSAQCRARVLDAVRNLPPGGVVSYAEIARRAGLPRHARWVARVLAENSDPTLPWHRVVRADGRTGFEAGSAAEREQLRRLAAEGVSPGSGGRLPAVPDSTRGVALDALLWGPRRR